MRTWLRRVAVGLACTVAVMLVVGMVLPTTYTVSRSVIIEADPEDIHEYVGDLTKWDLWAPWTEADPTIVVRFGDKASGVGASQSWVGEDGRGFLFDCNLPGGASDGRSAVRYHATDDNTRVTWIFKGAFKMPIIGGYRAAMMDSMVGGMFEQGLARLKHTVEERVDAF